MTPASRPRNRSRALLLLLPALAVALGAILTGCGTGGVDKDTNASGGKELFVGKCGSCHVLADAGTKGRVGPDLDAAFEPSRMQGFAESTIRQIVRDQIHYPAPAEDKKGFPTMPADLVTGSDASAVAAYVASVAGTGAKPSGPSGGGSTNGNEIFASAGCGSCHTLADARTTGTIGPDLDRAKPSFQLAVDRVRNGKAPMPAFKDQLSKAQIDAVAKYVSSVAGK